MQKRSFDYQLNSPWIDVSVSIRTGMLHWPGDSEIAIKKDSDMAKGDSCTVSSLSMNAHTGTHMDAPSHFIQSGKTLDELPFEAVLGIARVVVIEDPKFVQVEELLSHHIREGEKILFKTRNSSRQWFTEPFRENFVSLTKETASYLAQQRIQTLGIDYLSIGGVNQDAAVIHQLLLGAGIWIIEGLNLADVAAGEYELICLPLRIAGAEGSPARVILRQI